MKNNKQAKTELNEKINSLLETNAGDIGQFPELIKPLLYKIYTESLVSEIADVQQLNSPSGRVFSLFSNYGGRDNDDLNSKNSVIITLSDTADNLGLAIDDTLSTSTGTGKIVYVENDGLLVLVTSGYFDKNQAILSTSGNTVSVISNRHYLHKVFSNYSGPFSTATGETTNPPSIDQEILSRTIDVKTRKLKSKISREVLTDIKNMFGEDISKDMLAKEFGSEIVQSIDMEIIDYLKTIATPISDIVLSNSYAVTGGSLGDIGADLYTNIYKLTTDIMRDTKRRKNFFIMCDAATMGIMMASPLHVKPDKDHGRSSHFMGYVGGSYPLYLDPYSTDNYVVVGYRNETADELGDSGLIFAPYVNTIYNTVEPETGKEVFFQNVRYGYCMHPQDTGTGNNDSIFFKMFNVNLINLHNYNNIH